jgi:hypothetical protein
MADMTQHYVGEECSRCHGALAIRTEIGADFRSEVVLACRGCDTFYGRPSSEDYARWRRG